MIQGGMTILIRVKNMLLTEWHKYDTRHKTIQLYNLYLYLSFTIVFIAKTCVCRYVCVHQHEYVCGGRGIIVSSVNILMCGVFNVYMCVCTYTPLNTITSKHTFPHQTCLNHQSEQLANDIFNIHTIESAQQIHMITYVNCCRWHRLYVFVY